jgi:hypothetical protein
MKRILSTPTTTNHQDSATVTHKKARTSNDEEEEEEEETDDDDDEANYRGAMWAKADIMWCRILLHAALLSVELPPDAFDRLHVAPISERIGTIEPESIESEAKRLTTRAALAGLVEQLQAAREENQRLHRRSQARAPLLGKVDTQCPARPYHYLRWHGATDLMPVEWHMPSAHAPLVEPNFGLLPELERWAAHQAECLSSCLSDPIVARQIDAYSAYCRNDYLKYWEAFEKRPDDPGAVYPNAEHLHSLFFDNPWMGEVALPVGTVLFEGQGLYERDLMGRLEAIVPGDVVESQRPRSTSYVPNVALHFLGGNEYAVPGVTRQDLARHSPHEAYHQYAIRRGHYHTEGCLLVLRVAGDGVLGLLRQGLEPGEGREGEITLQPFLRMVCTDVRRNVELPRVFLGRVGVAELPCKVAVVHFDVSVALDTAAAAAAAAASSTGLRTMIVKTKENKRGPAREHMK